MSLRIRTAEPLDQETIVQFQLEMALETEDLQLDPATVNRGVRAVLKDPAKGTYYVAEQDGTVQGVLLTVPEWSDWRNGTVLWIHSVYVRPEMRGKGVYKALYLHLKEQVSEEPMLRGLRLYVEQKNTRAQSVYEKLGMSKDHYFLYEWLK